MRSVKVALFALFLIPINSKLGMASGLEADKYSIGKFSYKPLQYNGKEIISFKAYSCSSGERSIEDDRGVEMEVGHKFPKKKSIWDSLYSLLCCCLFCRKSSEPFYDSPRYNDMSLSVYTIPFPI
jgi:hypothetical protein